MNKGKLIELMNQFVEEQDDVYKDEYWMTDREISDRVIGLFRNFLIEKGEL